MKKRKWMYPVFLVVFLTIPVSCKNFAGKEHKTAKQPVPFEICREEKLPDELKELIREKQEEPFQLTYQNASALYIAAGYGRQPGGEYVAALRDLYETEQGIYVDTTLLFLSYAEEQRAGEPSVYPYVVLKCRKTGKTVFFL